MTPDLSRTTDWEGESSASITIDGMELPESCIHDCMVFAD